MTINRTPGIHCTALLAPDACAPLARPLSGSASIQGYEGPSLRSPVPRDGSGLLQTPHEGWVLMEFDIDARGRVLAVRVVASCGEPGFDDAACDAVSHWQFRPALVCGRLAIPSTCRQLVRVRVERSDAFGSTFRGTLERALWKIHDASDAGFASLVEGELSVLAVRPAERAHLALLQADLQRIRGEPGQELRVLRAALVEDGRHLAVPVRALALRRALRLELEFGLPGDALASVEALERHEGERHEGTAGSGVDEPLPRFIREWVTELRAGVGAPRWMPDRALSWRLPWFDQVLLADPAWIMPPAEVLPELLRVADGD